MRASHMLARPGPDSALLLLLLLTLVVMAMSLQWQQG